MALLNDIFGEKIDLGAFGHLDALVSSAVESLSESSAYALSLDPFDPLPRALYEAGFTGTVKDSAGRERHYVDGKQVAAPKSDATGDKGTGAGARTSPEERKAVEADLAEKLGPETAKKPGLLARAADAAVGVAARVYLKMVEWQPAAWKALGALDAIVDTPDDMKKFGYNPAFGATSGVGQNDPVSANLGVSTHLALSVASNVLSRALTLAKSKLGGGKAESEYDGPRAVAEMLADLFAAVNETLGATGGAPSADEVAANIKKLLKAS